MPWRDALRSRATSSLAFVALSMSAALACTTVASAPDLDQAEPGPSVAGMSVALTAAPALGTAPASAAPSVVPGTSPATSPTPAPTPVLTASAAPSVAAPAAPIAEAVPSTAPVARAERPRLDAKTTARLQRIIDNRVANKGVAGVQVAVRLASGESWTGSAGNAQFDPDRPLEVDDQMAIASVTKTFVAALILQLADEGKVDLDATFGQYFRDAPRKDTVTLRQLLSHTSGIYNFWANPRYGEISTAWWRTPNAGGRRARDHRWTYEEMLGLVRGGEFKPGTDYQYSNTNFLILGQVAEAVEGKPLHKQLRQRFFKPLGLGDTLYQPAERPRRDAAHGHWNWGGGYTDHTKDSAYVPFMAAASIADAAGAMASSARDLATWASALYSGDLLGPELTAEMTTFRRPGWYGLGADLAYFAGHRGFGHRGGIRGYEASMWYFAESGVSIVLLSNQGNWSTDPVMSRLVRAVLGTR